MHGPAGQALHYCNSTCAWSRRANVTFLWRCVWMVHLSVLCIIVMAHVRCPAGLALHNCTGVCTDE